MNPPATWYVCANSHGREHFGYKVNGVAHCRACDATAVLAYDAAAMLLEVARSGVEAEADPPGIDWVTVQIDQDTWDQIQAWRTIGGES